MIPIPHIYVALLLIQVYMNCMVSSDSHVDRHIHIIQYEVKALWPHAHALNVGHYVQLLHHYITIASVG